MPHPLSTDEARARLREAVATVESRSAAEVAVAIRERAAPHREAQWLGGALVAYAALLFMLFAPPVFRLSIIAIGTAVAFALGVALVRAIPGLERALVSTATREDAVAKAARATFVQLGVDRTRERSGILVFVAVLEQRVFVVADRGVTGRMEANAWQALEAKLRDAHRALAGADAASTLAKAIEAMADELSIALPRRDDDTNELEDVA